MKPELTNNQDCVKSVCVDKSSYKISRILLDELWEHAQSAKQTPHLELLIQAEDGSYYRLRCIVEKVRL